MSNADTRVESYFANLEAALHGPNKQSDAILAEVRADLEAQVHNAIDQGTDRELAWANALDSIGEPAALAKSMREALPPAPPKPWVCNLRMILTGLVAAWTLYLLYGMRSWDYGIDLSMTLIILGFHLPLALLLWPGLIWRWNPLFSTGASLAVLFLMLSVELWARNTPITHELGVEVALATPGDSTEPAANTTSALDLPDPDRLSKLLLPLGFGGLIVLVFTMLQRRKQRFVVLAWVLGLLAPVEAVHQTEEALFCAEGRNAVAWVRAFETANDRLPTSEEFQSEYEPVWLSRVTYYVREQKGPDSTNHFSIAWARATCRNHGLIYHSDGTVVGHD